MGRLYSWPAERIEQGDWNAVQWYDSTLAEAVCWIEELPLLEPAGYRYQIEPSGRGVVEAFVKCDLHAPSSVPGFNSVSSILRTQLKGCPDVGYRPKKGKEQLANTYLKRRGHCLVASRMDTISGRLTALWSDIPSFGAWVPVDIPDEKRQKALVAWWNSTPVRMMLLNHRSRKLTYPKWSLGHLREIRIPKPDNPAWNSLKIAFDQVSDWEMKPMKWATQCETQKIIDVAAAQALQLPLDQLEDWRERLSKEPTVGYTIQGENNPGAEKSR